MFSVVVELKDIREDEMPESNSRIIGRIPIDIVLSVAEKGMSHWSARLIRDLGFDGHDEYNRLKCDLSKDSGFKQFHANSVGR